MCVRTGRASASASRDGDGLECLERMPSARGACGWCSTRARPSFAKRAFEFEKFFFQTDDERRVKYSPLARLCVCFLARTAVPNDARGMVQTNSVEFPFSVRGGRREQEAASENVLTPYVENGKYFKCVYDANANANTRSMTSGRRLARAPCVCFALARVFFRRVVCTHRSTRRRRH